MMQPTRIAAVVMVAGLAATTLAACSYALFDSDTTAGFNQSGRPGWAKPSGQFDPRQRDLGAAGSRFP